MEKVDISLKRFERIYSLFQEVSRDVNLRRLQWARKFITSGDVNTRDDNGLTPLMVAAIGKSSYALGRLVRIKGVDLDAEDRYGITALVYAELSVDVSKKALYTSDTKCLISYGADVNKKIIDGFTPLMVAILMFGDRGLSVVKSLINHGVDLNAKDNNDVTASMFAVRLGCSKIVRLLKEKDANA